MKMVRRMVCALLFVAGGVAEGARVTVRVDGWTGGVTNGWRFAGIGGDGAMTGPGCCIESPRWPEAEILTVTVALSCSTNRPNRFERIARGLRLDLTDGDLGDWRIEAVTLDYEGSLELPRSGPPPGFMIQIS